MNNEKFEKIVHECIDGVIEIMQTTFNKYFNEMENINDVVNFYINTLSNVLLHVHFETYQGKVNKLHIENLLETFCEHMRRAFIMKKECEEIYKINH